MSVTRAPHQHVTEKQKKKKLVVANEIERGLVSPVFSVAHCWPEYLAYAPNDYAFKWHRLTLTLEIIYIFMKTDCG